MRALYDLIKILPISLLAAVLFGAYTGMPEGSVFGYALYLAFSLWVILLRSMKRKNRFRSVGIVAVFVAGLLIAAGEENRLLFLEEYFWVVRLLCLSALALTVGIVMTKNVWIGRAVTAALPVYCAIGTILGFEISKEAFSLICLILLVRLAEEIQRRWRKSGCPDIAEHVTRIAPVFLAICLTVYILPAPDEPYDWQFAKDIWYNTASFFTRVYGYVTHPSDDYGSIGFSDSGGFLAGLNSSDEEVLFITAGNTTIRSFRLVGCVSGDFTGREWVFDTESDGYSRMLDTIETSCAVRKYAGTSQSDYLQGTNLFCETLFYNTRYIFSPAKIRLEATREKTPGLIEKNGSIVSEQRFGYKDSYLLSCYVLNYGNPDLAELLGSAAPIDEAEWDRTAKAEGALDKAGCSYEDYENYRKGIYETYCRSRGVSEQVAEILDGIRGGSESRYETLKNLETYLKTFEYSTSCGALPDSVTDAESFLDRFLLESQKGYCMHFATAFTLMANEMGIPCRYVQGYSVKRDINGNIVVRQSNAHAWPEAYFDNVGWVAFEPTPGYSVPSGWGPRADDTNDPEADNNSEDTDDTNDTNGSFDETEQSSAGISPLIFIIPSAAAVSFLLLFYAISRTAARRKYERMSSRDKFICLTGQNLRLLGYLGFRIEEGETLSEYTNRIMSSENAGIKEHIGFIPTYETALYSDREITDEDAAAAEDAYRSLRELVKKSKLKFRLLMLIRNQ